jgi:hypothetical protein
MALGTLALGAIKRRALTLGLAPYGGAAVATRQALSVIDFGLQLEIAALALRAAEVAQTAAPDRNGPGQNLLDGPMQNLGAHPADALG